jgi:acetyl-CoA synthetase
LKENEHANPDLREKLRQHVSTAIGAIAKPDEIRFADALPKTRSGKIMRRLLKEIAGGGQVTGDTTTLEDFNVLAKLKGIEE